MPRAKSGGVGLLLAAVLPFILFSTASSDALRESKLAAQAAGAVIALVSLSRRNGGALPALRGASLGARVAVLAAALTAGLAGASALANASRVDPFSAAPVLSALALVLCASTAEGEAETARALPWIVGAGAFTGLLAGLQRFAGIAQLPLEAPEPRFTAAGLIGNPGDVAAALLLPALLAWMGLVERGATRRRRLLAGAALGAILFGIGATESIAPLLALGFGMALHALFDRKTRLLPLLAVVALALAASFATGALRRATAKWEQLRKGNVGIAVTQRDIGFYAAAEMVRARPLLGVGPGDYSNAFVAARLAAEERAHRRLVHLSESAHFDNAHSEPLTLAAECGLPAAVLALGAASALLFTLFRRVRAGDGGETGLTAADLLVLLASFGVLCLGSFPLRLPVTLGPAALFLGVSLRRILPVREESDRARRRPYLALVLAVGLTALARALATLWQAEGEYALQAAALLPAESRVEALADAKTFLLRSLALRPRRATAALALGSAYRLERQLEAATARYTRSLELEERAETDLNLGRVLLASGAGADAHALFVRGVWVLPRLATALPAESSPSEVLSEVEAAERALRIGGKAPPLPARFRSPL